MKVLVTGGAGFIGSYVVDALLAAGHAVAVVDDLRTGRRHRVHPDAEFHEVDVRDATSLRGVFQRFRPDVVSHQAAQSEVPFSVKEPVFDAEVNLIGGLNLLEACRAVDTRKVVFASTAALYGTPLSVPCDESHPIQALAPYGVSKAAFELYLAQYHRTFGLDFSVLRYANIYGGRQDAAALEGRVVAVFAQRMLAGDPVTIDGDGSQARDFVYATDVAAANVAALDGGSGETMHVSSGVPTTVREVFDRLAALTGYDRAPLHGSRRKGDADVIAMNPERIARALGWRATTTLQAGLDLTLAELREAPSLRA